MNTELIALADRLESLAQNDYTINGKYLPDGKQLLRDAYTLRQMAEQKPVAWGGYSGFGEWIVSKNPIYSFLTVPLYAAPVAHLEKR